MKHGKQKQLGVWEVTEAVENLCMETNCTLGEDVVQALEKVLGAEESPQGREVLKLLLENAELAAAKKVPICQDTGMAVFFVEVGQDLHIIGGSLTEAINEGVRRGYRKGFLRKSVVKDPFQRINTEDNTPAIIHYNLVPGDKLTLVFAPKGFGSENMGALQMFKPADGWPGVLDFVVKTVDKAGANACPPVIVGVGVGGTMEKAALLAKKALLRPLGTAHHNPEYEKLEGELLREINKLGIGPQGFGGRITALAVHMEVYPTHIAGLPVAVNLNCHASRQRKVVLEGRAASE
ncbi:MAG: fumarate hydratase [Desulfitobacteriia bacterium]